MKKFLRIKWLLGIIVIGILWIVVDKTVFADASTETYTGGPIKVVYDYIGHYALNYTGNTNHYDYWNATGTSKLVSRNYKDRTDFSSNNNSSAMISQTDSSSTIKHAFLIWQSRAESAATTQIGFITPTGAKGTCVAEAACKDSRTNANGEEYSVVYTMVADVTDVVCSENGGYGTYTVANIPVWDGVQEGEVVCGGESVASWQLIIVEESPNFPLRTISLNIVSQYFFNINHRVKVEFADISSPTGDISLQWYDLFVDVDSQRKRSGSISTDPAYWHDPSNYRYDTQTRGLYKNGVAFNTRDTGSLYGIGSAANGAIHGHLYDDKRTWNSLKSAGIVYLQENTNMGMCVTTLGIAVDVFAYDIIFDGNGADAGKMENLTCVYGRGYNLPGNRYSKQYYEFVGWNTKPDGSGRFYESGEYIRNLTAEKENIVLYAQWRPNIYKVNLDNQYATISGTKEYYEWYGVGNYATCNCEESISRIDIPIKAGYVFGGYYTEKSGGGIKYIDESGNILSDSMTFNSDTNLYAYWEPCIYKITLDNQGAMTTGTTEYYQKYGIGSYTTEACTDILEKIEIPTKKHYMFCGYYTEKNGEGQRIILHDGTIMNTYTWCCKDTTLYAYWEPVSYRITLDNQNAVVAGTKEYYEKYGVENYYKIYEEKPDSEQTVIQYEYTGSVQNFIVPHTGLYSIACAGASGEASEKGIDEKGSRGGFVSGDIWLNEGDILYIYVGGEGSAGRGGYNGGGDRLTTSLYGIEAYVLAGGGATDIRIGGTSLADRKMVAAGAGGDAYIYDESKDIFYSVDGATGTQGVSSNTIYVDESNFDIKYMNISNDLRSLKATTMTAGTGKVDDKLPLPDGYNTNDNAFIYEFNKGDLGIAALGGGGGYYGGGNAKIKLTRDYHEITDLLLLSGTSGSNYVGTDIENAKVKTASNAGNGYVTIAYYDTKIYTKAAKSITIPLKYDYVFSGYYSERNGMGTKYIDMNGNILASPSAFDSDTTLYAYWIRMGMSPVYNIAFNGNGADAGKMNIMSATVGYDCKLRKNAFSRTGYIFAGWSKTEDGEVLYKDEDTVKNLTYAGNTITLYAQWTPVSTIYKVNYYIQDLKGDYSYFYSRTEQGITGSTINVSTLAEEIFGFSYNHAEIKGDVATIATIKADGSLIINLYYTRNSYFLELKKSEGISFVSGTGRYKYGENVSIDAAVLSGYEWSKWSGTFNSTDKEYSFTMPVSDVTMLANANPITYVIHLDSQRANENGTLKYYEKYGSGNYADSECDTLITNIIIPQRTGYIFEGYYTEIEGEGIQYIDKLGRILSTPTTFIEDTVLYAKWTPITYNIHFEGNTHTSGNMNDMLCIYGKNFQLSENNFEKEQYKFVGWNTKADGTGDTFLNKESVSNLTNIEGAVITLYAQWTPNIYIIHFDANGGTGVMDDMECEFNVDYMLNSNKFIKTGYEFIGWSLKPDGVIDYKDKATVQNLLMTTGIVNLYAVWKPTEVSYIVNHYFENLEFTWELIYTEKLIGFTENVLEVKTLAKSMEGFTYVNGEVNGIVSEKVNISADGNIVINLYYTRNFYEVIIEKDSGISKTIGAGTYRYGTEVEIDAVVNLGYSWNCWSGTYGDTDRKYKFIMPARNVIMKANTNPVVYEIFLDNQNADDMGTEKYYEKYNEGNYADDLCRIKIQEISLPKKVGYLFGGYYTEIEGGGIRYVGIDGEIISSPIDFVEDTTLFAYWIPITYIVRFEGNGSDGGDMSDVHCLFNQKYKLSKNQFFKEHYTFYEWNTKVNGEGVGYTEQELVENLSNIQNDVITLYAQWKPDNYEVYFDANGGEGTMDTITLMYDIEQKLPVNEFTKRNEYGTSTFLGWATDATATAAIFENEAIVMNLPEYEDGKVILYAIWDDCPWIVAEDLYYSLYEAQNGLITYGELMSKAVAEDKEAGGVILPGIDGEKGTSFTIIDYMSTDFTNFLDSGSVTETYQVIDSVGNIFQKRVTVHIVNTTAIEIFPERTTRFIDEKYYNESYENGGLEENSIWKINPEYVTTIKKAFDNFEKGTPIMSFSFNYEEIMQMKDYIRINGIGNSQNPAALQNFYKKFFVCNEND